MSAQLIQQAHTEAAVRIGAMPNRVAMTRATHLSLFRELYETVMRLGYPNSVSVGADGHPVYDRGRLTEILGMRIDLDEEAIVPVASRVEPP